MRKFIVVLWGALSLAGLWAVLRPGPGGPLWASSAKQASPQEVQKPKYDYMSMILSRSTQPLGLKQDPAIKKLLNQGPVKWAIRAGSRHILD